jgi:hypothetical protein
MHFHVTSQYVERLSDRISETEYRIIEQGERIRAKRKAGLDVYESTCLLNNLIRSRDALVQLHNLAQRILRDD